MLGNSSNQLQYHTGTKLTDYYKVMNELMVKLSRGWDGVGRRHTLSRMVGDESIRCGETNKSGEGSTLTEPVMRVSL